MNQRNGSEDEKRKYQKVFSKVLFKQISKNDFNTKLKQTVLYFENWKIGRNDEIHEKVKVQEIINFLVIFNLSIIFDITDEVEF